MDKLLKAARKSKAIKKDAGKAAKTTRGKKVA